MKGRDTEFAGVGHRRLHEKTSPATLDTHAGHILNIHLSLLSRHDGQHVHEIVLASGDPVSGASVHHVTAEYDEGPAIARQEVPVLPDDTPKTLAERVLTAEHSLLPTTIAAIASTTQPI
ncbi:formyltransferase family protein [Streptomyces sp. NBC_01643]|uniref:formyltransferase family protein n=1 Tax=Streptomyces sp. NBC_01643 TaxID=2975906 RepID=UPI002F90C1CD|nr:formyltransferase family protein [Streptomyces sp. NBC_01643]